ncbi:MAG: TolC family protein [Prolixibacteraceae bacterium]|jgi:outer membrane protein TolC|nr:TolC family protein [Prolixibacteraceae bacterium]
MERIKIYLVAVVLLLVTQPCFSQETKQLSLDNYLELAAANNPEIKAAFNQYLAALEKVPQVGALPDPQASFGFFVKPMAIVEGSQVGNVQVMQMFPWFGTLKSGKDEASEMAKAKYQLLNAAKADLFYRVKSNWYQLVKLDREIILIRENIELMESLEKLALIKFRSPATSGGGPAGMKGAGAAGGTAAGNMNSSGSGMGAMNAAPGATKPAGTGSMQPGPMTDGMGSKQSGLQDVLRVRMEILEQKNKLALLVDQRRTEETGFNALLNRDLAARVQIGDSLAIQPLPSGKPAIADSILRNNPMLAMLENEIRSYTFMEQKAKKMGMPMLGLGLNYMVNEKREGVTSMMNGNDMLMPMVSVSIPIYRKKYNAMQNEARLMQEAGKQQAVDLQNNLLVQYRSFIQNLDDAERRISLYREQEELARKTTDLLLAGFTSTGTDYEEVLRMQYKVLDYGFKHIEAITDYNTSVAMAEKLMNSVKQ